MPPLVIDETMVLDALRDVYDPELGENLVELGLIYNVRIDGSRVEVDMTLTTEGCPLHDSLTSAAERAIRLMVPLAEEVVLNVVWDPPWTPERMSDLARRNLGW